MRTFSGYINKTFSFFSLFIVCAFPVAAQKKISPASQSTITGIFLPPGSTQDTRFITEITAKELLLAEAKKINSKVEKLELFYLPLQSNYSNDSLFKFLSAIGWTSAVIKNDNKYALLQKGNRSVLSYLGITKTAINLYFGELINSEQKNNNNVPVASGNTSVPVTPKTNQAVQLPDQSNNTSSVPVSFFFNTTNFDDGWVSSAKESWTEVTKNNLIVLLHYPNQQVDAYHSVLKEGDMIAWNSLVAPKYNSIQNFQWRTIQSYESITFIEADAVEKSTGKNVHIVLFKKHYTKGNGRYLEFITSSKAVFEQEFGPYHNDEFGWDKMSNMQFRNKYAVSENDLTGTWSANDYASLTYYYINGGGYAGTNATSTADEFTFLTGNNYKSDHAGASGVVGNQKFSRQVYNGKYTAGNWELVLTNRFKGETEKYSCYFEAIKGGRILVLTDRLGTTYTLVKKQLK